MTVTTMTVLVIEFKNNDLALRQTDSTEGVEDDDDDPWVRC